MKDSKYNVFFRYDNDVVLGYNSLTTGLVELTDEEYRGYQELAKGAAPSALLNSTTRQLEQELVRGRFLVDAEVDELSQLKAKFVTDRFLIKSLGLTIETTHNCNLACGYCYEERTADSLPIEMIPAIVRLVQSLVKENHTKRLDVTWYGGEPLLNTGALFELSERLQVMALEEEVEKYGANIVTNGTLLTRSTAQRLANHQVRSATVTLDGPKDIHDKRRVFRDGKGTFALIVENIKQAHDLIQIHVRVNVDINNDAEVERLFEVLEQEGLRQIITMSFHPVSTLTEKCSSFSHQCLSKEAFAPRQLALTKEILLRGFRVSSSFFLPSPARISCSVLQPHSLAVDARGMIHKCWNSLCNEQEALGRFVKQPSETEVADYVFQPSTRDNQSKWLSFDPFAYEKCRACEILPTCLGGCPWYVVGMGQEPSCGMAKHNLKESLWLYRELLNLHVPGEQSQPRTAPCISEKE